MTVRCICVTCEGRLRTTDRRPVAITSEASLCRHTSEGIDMRSRLCAHRGDADHKTSRPLYLRSKTVFALFIYTQKSCTMCSNPVNPILRITQGIAFMHNASSLRQPVSNIARRMLSTSESFLVDRFVMSTTLCAPGLASFSKRSDAYQRDLSSAWLFPSDSRASSSVLLP